MFRYPAEQKETDNWIQTLERLYSDNLKQDVYLVSYMNPYEALNHVKNNLQQIQGCAKVIVKTNCEAPFYTIWFELVEWLYTIGFTKETILIIDAGEAPDNESITWTHFGLPVINYIYEDTFEKVSIRKSKIFVSLARVPRNNRVIFTLELLKLGLYDDTFKKCIISCGVSEEHTDYTSWKYLVPKKYRDVFPIVPFGLTNQYDAVSTSLNYEEISSALINVIQETGFDAGYVIYPRSLDEMYMGADIKYLSETWDRKTFTEKTFKCFAMKQIPLFLSVPGYVNYVRSLGFDVFDDFVNHSYDEETNSLLRIKKVALELDRLYNILLQRNTIEYGECVMNFRERVENNYKIAADMNRKFFDIEMSTINTFLSKL